MITNKPECPWRKWPNEKPENQNNVMAVKRDADGILRGGENCYIEGRGWCDILGMLNQSAPDMWMPLHEYIHYCQKHGVP